MEPDDTLDLDARLAALRGAMDGIDAPRCVEKELMQAFAARFPAKRPWYQRLSLPEWGAAGACAAVTAVVLATLLAPPRHGDELALRTPLVRLDNGTAFIALDSFERIAQEPDPQLVEAEVPRTMLATLGLPVSPEQAGEPVRAELLVAADGEPLALRLTSIDH
ncbi:hypothetical protein [Massilia sp.]|uniref:hypothetical protein n=1 Tax=Massilia sp. TaxID=1882437 RepID=UPI0028AE47F8|nr:hypothetical protein [Massilia sp.]